ncbi:MAG: type II toxin-antitoxin system Phd/YefM family antitoxin [Micrococcales bacterium]|nr:type II toxin-antitoxin system Phd/YefM family antitoxin [Micrococcales bacterium]
MHADAVSVYEAKTNLSRLIAQAKAGFPFVITSHGKPQVIVQAVDAGQAERKPQRTGFLKDELKDFRLPDDFDTMMQDEIISLFEGD